MLACQIQQRHSRTDSRIIASVLLPVLSGDAALDEDSTAWPDLDSSAA